MHDQNKTVRDMKKIKRYLACNVANADIIHKTQIYPKNAYNIHGTRIYPKNADNIQVYSADISTKCG